MAMEVAEPPILELTRKTGAVKVNINGAKSTAIE